MTRTHKILGVLSLVLLGVWGCTQPSGTSAKQLETRLAKLEDELKSTIVSRDALKVRLAALEEQVRAESERAKMIERERDELTAKLQSKSAEKEVVVAQYDDLVKKIEAILGHAKVTQSKHVEPGPGKIQGTVSSMPKN